jgi:AcrR family transcriptional regulator
MASALKPSRKWTRRADARPDEILEAALQEFVERGFEAARMEDIARRAGLSKAGVYLYFESKDALLKALIESRMTPLIQEALSSGMANAADPKMALKMIATVIATRLRDPKNFAVPKLVISLSARFPEIADFYRTHVVEHARRALESLMTAGIAQGVFRKVDPKAAARAFIGPILFEALWAHILRGESALDDPAVLASTHLDILLEGLSA